MSYIAERRQEEKDRRRGEILDAATELYREIGWDAVTMDAVARRARLSRALVYVYFKDKDALHLAIAVQALELLRERFIEAAERERRGLDKVAAIGRAYIAYAYEFPHYFDACSRMELRSPTQETPDAQELACMQYGDRVHEVVVDALTTGIEDGSIRSDVGAPALVSRVLWGFTHGIMQIGIRKAQVLAASGISAQALMDQAHLLMTKSLAAPD
ncbi:MAG: helix-turn-helix domain-containing protein [Steroidobacteraceae bacterium]